MGARHLSARCRHADPAFRSARRFREHALGHRRKKLARRRAGRRARCTQRRARQPQAPQRALKRSSEQAQSHPLSLFRGALYRPRRAAADRFPRARRRLCARSSDHSLSQSGAPHQRFHRRSAARRAAIDNARQHRHHSRCHGDRALIRHQSARIFRALRTAHGHVLHHRPNDLFWPRLAASALSTPHRPAFALDRTR